MAEQSKTYIQDQVIAALKGLLYTAASTAVALLCWIALSALDELKGIKGEMKTLNDQMIAVVSDQKWQGGNIEEMRLEVKDHEKRLNKLEATR